ncbi:A24 family peptidase [Clostridium sp.]|uniref:prepilin peptidase n=1 Tax=Clostridium sp. TaxID=1506 RepID=UPI0025C68955|nr:A24 family peptidase [Clostridium sp.]MCI9069815.1 prepilin peptidase [Clostridium sp.]MCI9303895.1 prepilin peptidase [Clostridium sp.]
MYIALIILMGLLIGSFLNVCIYRIARGESISFPPSHCTNCGYNLKPKDLIPVLSYIFLGGKCRSCKEKISIQYPIVEILNAFLYVMVYIKYGFTLNLFKFCLLSSLLIVIAFIDFKTKYVYNSTIVFGVISGIGFAILEWIETKTIPINYMIGAFIGFGVIYLIVILTRGMGEGDIDIALICGLFLGFKGIIVTLFLSIILGGIVAIAILVFKLKDKKSEIAFGPYLAIGAISSFLFGEILIDFYFKII